MYTSVIKIVLMIFAVFFSSLNELKEENFQGKAYYFSKSKMELGRWGARMSEAEKIKFVNKFKRTVYDLTLNAKNGNEGVTNLLGTLSAINLHQRAQEQSFNLSETRIISTMFDAENPSLDDLNNYFVTEIQRSELPESFPDAIIAGMPIDTDVIDLWKDIYSINGQEFRYEVN